MQIIFSIIKWILIGLVGLILLGLSVPQVSAFLDARGKEERASYLLEHNVYIGDLGTMADMSFPDAFYDNRLFLFGEIHGVAGPQDVDIALIDHLNENIGLRWYMAELGPETAMAFNHYLSTGDDSRAKIAFDGWADENYQWANKEFFEKLGKIRAANLERPSAQRIYFIGVDRIQHEILADSARNQPFANYDDDHADTALAINKALLAATRARGTAKRYEHIMANIDLMMADPRIGADEPIYGFWGLFHALQVSVNDTARPLALRLQDHPAFEKGITSLVAVYGPGSMMMWPAQILPGPLQGKEGETYTLLPMGNDNPYMGYTAGIRDLQTAANGADVAIFNIDALPSPYTGSNRFVSASGISTLLQKFEVNGTASEATDYIVYLEGSPALTPWRGAAYDFTGRLKE